MKRYVIGAFVMTYISASITIVWRDELVVLSPYTADWSVWYRQEVGEIAHVFTPGRMVQIEHFGSTSVPGMLAKPVVDILVGLDAFGLSNQEIENLRRTGYDFIEKSTYCERYYFKKGGACRFNVSFVKFDGSVWHECLDVRDYLRTHPGKVTEYCALKQQALAHGCVTLAAYSKYKQEFVRKLSQEAALWRKSLGQG